MAVMAPLGTAPMRPLNPVVNEPTMLLRPPSSVIAQLSRLA
jgi:hypothetical protein